MPESTSHSPDTTGIIVVRPDPAILDQQNFSQFVGISADTAGAKGISMCLVILPPGATAKPHIHSKHETAIYLLKGQVELHYGQGLKQSRICGTGDFVFTPPGVPHQPRNLSATEPVYVLAARNDPAEQEESVPYHPTPES